MQAYYAWLIFGCIILAVIIMVSLLCLRFMNGILDWGDKQGDYATHILNGNYRRVDTEAGTGEKPKHPHGAITIHTIQPYGEIMREEESDVPYTEDSDMEIEYIYPIQRLLNSKENLGKLYYSLKILPSSKLVINLLRADELPEAKNDYPRVYVTISLLHNNNITNTNQELKSKVQQGTYSPHFNERFEFDIKKLNVDEMLFLRLVVWYVDSFSQGECLGMVEHNLDKLTVSEEGTNEQTIVCKDIQRIARDFQDENGVYGHYGAVLFSLTYAQTTKLLTVVLFKAQNLNLISDDNQGIYAEVTIIYVKKNRRKRKVTQSMPGTNNPVYNEAILFDLSDLETQDMKLQITLKQKRTDKPDIALGRVLLGSDVYNSDAKLHWNSAMNANRAVAEWHNLRQCQSYNYNNRRRLRNRLSCSENEVPTDSSSSDD
ncbi:synaptotagmin-1-like isoform X2 [Dendronephthya gigantea]|uniref:synaptotagmin-1-like isoform X2 n=1 Tax=Dendronephthya gigantea TaxID=151771 RepID=UPI00106963E3|nr:synaptotagmin-1-like isoform X2 [Dendronephthya gigantea]